MGKNNRRDGATFDQSSIVAIIPAYNEDGNIAEIITSCQDYVDQVIVVNDASTDETERMARQYADGVITHPENMGVGAAVHTGYLAAIQSQYDIVIQIDGDGQHDSSYIPDLVQTMSEENADMVIGSRWLNQSYKEFSFIRRSGIKFFTFMANFIGGTDISDVTSGFRAYDTEMLSQLGRPANNHWAFEQTLEAARKDYTITEISVPMPPPTEGSQFDFNTFLSFPPRMILATMKVLLFR